MTIDHLKLYYNQNTIEMKLKNEITNSVESVAMLEGVKSSWKWMSNEIVSSGICLTAYIFIILYNL